MALFRVIFSAQVTAHAAIEIEAEDEGEALNRGNVLARALEDGEFVDAVLPVFEADWETIADYSVVHLTEVKPE